MSELKKLDKYFNRPSTELIFLTRAEHYKWPHKGTLEAALKNKGKTPWNKGKTFGKKYAEKCIRAQKTCKKVNAFDLSGTFIKSFPSISNAAKELKLNLANVRSVVHGRKSSTCGYIFVLA